MNTLGQKISTRSSSLVDGEGSSAEPIPIDLIIEIFSWLPVKSIARCRCVSKQCGSILVSPEFRELALTRSEARPKILFACHGDGKLFLYSSPDPQLQNPSSLIDVDDYHIKFPFNNSSVCKAVSGLICLQHSQMSRRKEERVLMICNPSTGQSLPFPNERTRYHHVKIFFGYDPIDKQFKLLSMKRAIFNGGEGISFYKKHQILTLGNKKPPWRMIECSVPHIPQDNGICINGVLYYTAWVKRHNNHWKTLGYKIVCFDIRSEKFEFIEQDRVQNGTLVNYKGKLSIVESYATFHGRSTSLELSVLEDTKWSTQTYQLPPQWEHVIGNFGLNVIGATRRGEIVFSPCSPSVPYYLFYYNIERNTIIKVGYQGMDLFKGYKVTTFLDHVERM